MRRFTLLLVVAIIASMFAVTSTYAAEEKGLSVFVDGEAVTFTTDPFIENGTTLVPFRTIFTKLGLSIGWDGETKTATGSKEGLTIQLQIGSKTAVVNGENKELTVAPKVVNGETFIPLRFISENAQKEVSWDGITKEIYIADAELQIVHLFDKHIQYNKEENLAGVMSTIDPSSPGYAVTEEILSNTFAMYDLDYTVNAVVYKIEEETAIVITMISTTKIDGPGFTDNVVHSVNELRKINGQWKIYSTDIAIIEYDTGDLDITGEITISDTEKNAILAVIEQSRLNNEKEDWEEEALLYSSDYPNLDQYIEESQQLGEVYDFTFEVLDIEFLEASDERAVVFYETKIKKTAGPDNFQNFASGVQTVFEKINGKWLMTNSYLTYYDFSENFEEYAEEELEIVEELEIE